jgi:hypothetical protein
MMTRLPVLILPLLLLAGCMAQEFANTGGSDQRGPFPSSSSDGIVFVGTDDTFTENVFVADATDPSSVISLTTNQVDEWPQSGEEDEYYPGTLLSASAPYGIPDPSARYVAFVTVPTVPTELPEGRVSLAEEYMALRTSMSIVGLQEITFSPSGDHLVLTLVDEAGDTTLQVMDPRLDLTDLNVCILNEDLGPAAVSDLQYQGRGRAADSILVSGEQGDPGVAGVWEVPLPDGDVTLLTAALDRDALEPAVSPGGAFVAVELFDPESNRSDIAVYDSDADSWQIVTEDMPAFDYRSPRWEPSPDHGERLAFLQYYGEGVDDVNQLCVATHDGAGTWSVFTADVEAQLLEGRLISNPRWNPTGGELLLDYRITDNASGLNVAGLVIYDVDAAHAQLLTTDGEPELAHWSHDGNKILMWDRSVDTNSDTSERTPIRLYDQGTGRTENVFVEASDENQQLLYIEYPLFLYQNTLWY